MSSLLSPSFIVASPPHFLGLDDPQGSMSDPSTTLTSSSLISSSDEETIGKTPQAVALHCNEEFDMEPYLLNHPDDSEDNKEIDFTTRIEDIHAGLLSMVPEKQVPVLEDMTQFCLDYDVEDKLELTYLQQLLLPECLQFLAKLVTSTSTSSPVKIVGMRAVDRILSKDYRPWMDALASPEFFLKLMHFLSCSEEDVSFMAADCILLFVQSEQEGKTFLDAFYNLGLVKCIHSLFKEILPLTSQLAAITGSEVVENLPNHLLLLAREILLHSIQRDLHGNGLLIFDMFNQAISSPHIELSVTAIKALHTKIEEDPTIGTLIMEAGTLSVIAEKMSSDESWKIDESRTRCFKHAIDLINRICDIDSRVSRLCLDIFNKKFPLEHLFSFVLKQFADRDSDEVSGIIDIMNHLEDLDGLVAFIPFVVGFINLQSQHYDERDGKLLPLRTVHRALTLLEIFMTKSWSPLESLNILLKEAVGHPLNCITMILTVLSTFSKKKKNLEDSHGDLAKICVTALSLLKVVFALTPVKEKYHIFQAFQAINGFDIVSVFVVYDNQSDNQSDSTFVTILEVRQLAESVMEMYSGPKHSQEIEGLIDKMCLA